MAKIEIELPDDLKRSVEVAAKLDHRTEEDIICAAVQEAMQKRPRKPRIPLFTDDSQFPADLGENVDEYLKGFGE